MVASQFPYMNWIESVARIFTIKLIIVIKSVVKYLNMYNSLNMGVY